MQSNWSVEYNVQRAFGEGFAVLLVGPCPAHESHCIVKAQRTVGDWLGFESWYRDGLRHPSLRLTPEEGGAIYELLAKARIGALPPFAAGMDGETHHLRLGMFLNEASYTWFCELPNEWSELKGGVDALSDLASRCLTEGT